MPNHVHLILNPRDELGLGRAVGEAHRRYTNFINGRRRSTGHLFQSRFASVSVAPVLEMVGGRFADLLETDADAPDFGALRAAETTGRPVGAADFIEGLERRLGRKARAVGEAELLGE